MAAFSAGGGGATYLKKCEKDILVWQRFSRDDASFQELLNACPGLAGEDALKGDQQSFEPLRVTYFKHRQSLKELRKTVRKAREGQWPQDPMILARLQAKAQDSFKDMTARVELFHTAMIRYPAPSTALKGGATRSLYDDSKHAQYLQPSNRVCIICGLPGRECERKDAVAGPMGGFASKRLQFLHCLPELAPGQCCKSNLQHYGLICELYMKGLGLHTDDVMGFLAWADQRKLVKHMAKLEPKILTAAEFYLSQMRAIEGKHVIPEHTLSELHPDPKLVVKLFCEGKFGQLKHSEICFLEAAIDISGFPQRRPDWATLHEATARLVVLNVQVLHRGEWCMEATARGFTAPEPAYDRASDNMHRQMAAMPL